MKSPAVAPAEVVADLAPLASAQVRQARHVFLAGNGLPGRWQGRRRFVVLDTGFGLGSKFLATWHAWRQDPARCEQLVFVCVEPHPPRQADLDRAHAGTALGDLAAQLASRWPPLTAGLHTRSFEGGRVELLLALGDARELLRSLVLAADAFYLDGPTSPRGAEPWDPWLLKSLARHAAPGATAAACGAPLPLQHALASLGFEVSPVPGRADAPGMTVARFAPRHTPQRPAGREPLAPDARHALIVGAGLAGAACALALARQGVACTVVEALAAPAQASSGNPAGLFHGTVNPDDGPHARFNRAAALATQALLAELALPHQPGLLRLETRLPRDAMRGAPGYVEPLSADEAAARAGTPPGVPAWLYPGGGALDPRAYVAAMLAASGAALKCQVRVAALRHDGGGWAALDGAGTVVGRAPLVVLAGGPGQLPLLAANGLAAPCAVQRGQLTHLAGAPWCPALPVAGDGYAIADGHGGVWCGATTHDGDLDPLLRAADQHDNLARYARLAGLAGLAVPPEAPLAGRVGWRLVAPDKLPLVGGLAAPGERAGQLRLQPRLPGLLVCTGFASRGITWAALAGRLVAALALGSPRPLEADLLDAVDPLRFDLRGQRRGHA